MSTKIQPTSTTNLINQVGYNNESPHTRRGSAVVCLTCNVKLTYNEGYIYTCTRTDNTLTADDVDIRKEQGKCTHNFDNLITPKA